MWFYIIQSTRTLVMRLIKRHMFIIWTRPTAFHKLCNETWQRLTKVLFTMLINFFFYFLPLFRASQASMAFIIMFSVRWNKRENVLSPPCRPVTLILEEPSTKWCQPWLLAVTNQITNWKISMNVVVENARTVRPLMCRSPEHFCLLL